MSLVVVAVSAHLPGRLPCPITVGGRGEETRKAHTAGAPPRLADKQIWPFRRKASWMPHLERTLLLSRVTENIIITADKTAFNVLILR